MATAELELLIQQQHVCHCCSVVKSCWTLCNPMDCRLPGSSVLHYLLEFATTWKYLKIQALEWKKKKKFSCGRFLWHHLDKASKCGKRGSRLCRETAPMPSAPNSGRGFPLRGGRGRAMVGGASVKPRPSLGGWGYSTQALKIFTKSLCTSEEIARNTVSGYEGFLGGSVVKHLPAKAGDTGSIPDLGRSHRPQSN